MAKKSSLTNTEQVSQLIMNSPHPLKDAIECLRQSILAAHPLIAEEVKWNSPSFYYTGEMEPFDPKEYKRDILVLNLHKPEFILLVFPTGAKLEDNSEFLEGNFKDTRKIAKVHSLDEAMSKAEILQKLINQWIDLVI